MEGTSVEIAAPVRGIVIQDNECTARQTDLLAAENLRGKDYYR
jgi:hypothetical protein